jgi:hypothetical protein
VLPPYPQAMNLCIRVEIQNNGNRIMYLCDSCERGLGIITSAIFVGMPLARQLPVRFDDDFLVCGLSHAQHSIGIALVCKNTHKSVP